MLRISSVRPGSVDFGDLRYHRSAQDHANYTVIRGDLLVVRYNGNARFVAACGMVRDAVDGCVYPDKLIRIRVDPAQAIPEYVELAMLTPDARRQLDPFIKTAAGQHGISGKDLRRLVITLPPMAEQRRIVARIEALFARTRRARADLERSALLAERFRRTALAGTFGGSEGHDWPSRRLVDLVREARIGLVRSKADQSDTDGTPYIRMQHYDLFGRWNAADLSRVKISAAEAASYELRPDDLLFNTRNSTELVGKVAIWPQDRPGFVFNNNLLRLRFKNGACPNFMRWALAWSSFAGELNAAKSATTSVAAIYQRDLMDMMVPMPEEPEQQRIASRLSAQVAGADTAERQSLLGVALLDRLEQGILARAFRGELVPQGPAEVADAVAPAAQGEISPAVRRRRMRAVAA